MGEQIKYLVQVQCQPLPQGQEGQIVRELGQELSAGFPVKQCRSNRDGMIVELVSSHPLAYGALKDLADLIEQSLSRRGAQLKSGVINQAVPGLVGAAASAVIHALERRAVARTLLIGLLGRFAARIFGPARPVPVLYFHWGLSLDLMLAGKLKRTPQLEPTI
jgi:hypothetical protein